MGIILRVPPPQPEAFSPGDVSLIYSWDETPEESHARNRELYAHGWLTLSSFEYRAGVIISQRERT